MMATSDESRHWHAERSCVDGARSDSAGGRTRRKCLLHAQKTRASIGSETIVVVVVVVWTCAREVSEGHEMPEMGNA